MKIGNLGKTILTGTTFVVVEKIPWAEKGFRVFSHHKTLEEAKQEASELNSKVLSASGFFAAEQELTVYGTVHMPPRLGKIIKWD